MVGCQHDPLNACAECLEAMSAGNAAFFATDLRPEPGETLDSFQQRVRVEKTLKSTDPTPEKPAYVEPSREEQKRIIRDESIPEPIRRFWRERLYGKGGTGRKGIQQDRAQRTMQALTENLTDRTMKKLAAEAGTLPPKVRPKGMSGRQWRRARKLLRSLAKTVKAAA